jgi:hypothetical protein
MALIHMDGFDKYTVETSDDELVHYGYNAVNCRIEAGLHGNCVAMTSFSSFLQWFPAAADIPDASGFCGFRFRSPGTPNGGVILTIADVTRNHLQLYYNTDGTIGVRRNTTELSNTTARIPVGSWGYVEFSWTIDNSVGAYECRINGTANGGTSDTGVDTQDAGTASWVSVILRTQANSTPDEQFDDFYILNTTASGVTGAPNNDFLGDCRIETLFPTGAGNATELTPSTGSNWENVDDNPGMDEDSTYNESAGISDQDTYATGNISVLNDDIRAIQHNMLVKKTDVGARTMRSVIRDGGTDYYGATRSLGTDYTGYSTIEEGDNPGGGTSQWTATNVDALEIGVDVDS